MKNKVYILSTILSETQKSFPWIDVRKFKILYDGWRQQGLRNKSRSAHFFTLSWKRGWLPPNDADSLRKYIGVL